MNNLFSEADRLFADRVVAINASNPFLPKRIECERAALGEAFVESGADWNTLPPSDETHPNHLALIVRIEGILDSVRQRWPKSARVSSVDTKRYEGLAGFWLYQSYVLRFDRVIRESEAKASEDRRLDFFPAFKADAQRLLDLPGIDILETHPAEHLFACAFQIRRAFHHIFRTMVGGSRPMAQLRASIWQSIFTHDLDRYRRVLYGRMGDFATLITGPSGTGKELVARAIGLSRYLAYEPRRGGFAGDYSTSFFPLHLSALSPTLIESELFGHRRGAFTGALGDREGWMEVCPETGTVFLDEIGEVDSSIQVKLLRVLQARTFQRLGDTENRHFKGKVIAATNRDLAAEIAGGRFREDFYYRLCSDQIRTPSLREQLDDRPEDLEVLVHFVAVRMMGRQDEGEAFARDALCWIGKNLGETYAWPGNFRELEQCVRNLLVRGDYQPMRTGSSEDLGSLINQGRLTAEEVLQRYTRMVHASARTIEETARRLNVDRRTVKARLG